ncbi:hypothetical protein DH2020_036690 [Rehmannia glutinosa]|uniref:KNOX1 domain-containing protein n=1 Tax=Rehmannia glutinosa TaxID=99300 RepID=A0ABR0V3U5_REHGL
MAFPNHLSQEEMNFSQNSPPFDDKPTVSHWLNTAILRHPNLLNTDSDAATNQWLSRSILLPSVSDDSMMAESADLNDNGRNQNRELTDTGGEGAVNWQIARLKADILSHPLYEQLLSAHVACLRIATPVDQLPRIDAQLAQSQQVVEKYSALGHGSLGDEKDLDQFIVLEVFVPKIMDTMSVNKRACCSIVFFYSGLRAKRKISHDALAV